MVSVFVFDSGRVSIRVEGAVSREVSGDSVERAVAAMHPADLPALLAVSDAISAAIVAQIPCASGAVRVTK